MHVNGLALAGVIVLTAFCVGCESGRAPARDDGFSDIVSTNFYATTTGERTWSGAEKARIDIYSGHDGDPAEAHVSFYVGSEGKGLSLLFVVEPSELLSPTWNAQIGGSLSTTAGFGVMTISTGSGSNIDATGHVSAGVVSGELRGSFDSSDPDLQAGTFHGDYTVSCHAAQAVPEAGQQESSVGGWVEGGYIIVEDTRFETSFCAPFAGL